MTPERRLVPGVRDSFLAGLDAELDQLDLKIIGERRLLVRELRPKLAALGFDVSRFTEPPFPRPSEQRTSRHAHLDDLPLARVQLKASKRGRLVRSTGHVLRVR